MKVWIEKLMPLIVVMTVAVYLSWPAIAALMPGSESASKKPEASAKQGKGGKKKEEKAPKKEITAAMLSLDISPKVKRQPFMPFGAMETAADSVKKPGDKSPAPTSLDNLDNTGLVLNATCIIGGTRLALINHQVYQEKEMIRQPIENAPQLIVTDIFPHKVILTCHGRQLQLCYLDTAGKPASGKRSVIPDARTRRIP